MDIRSSTGRSSSSPPQSMLPPDYQKRVKTDTARRVPRRDWRDWFIMATVVGGVSYGLYFTAKVRCVSHILDTPCLTDAQRYLVPLIKPPTPPQIEQDKAAIDEQFTRAFALLDQLATDTAALKAAEEARTTRLDAALDNLDIVVKDLTEADRRRNDDSRRTADEIRGLRDQLPRAMEAQKESTDGRLRELSQELKSLKTLIGNRMGNANVAQAPGHQRPLSGAGPASYGVPATTPAAAPAAPAAQAAPVEPAANGASSTAPATPAATTPAASTPAAAEPAAASSASPYNRFGSGGKAAIPAWQMAASKKANGEPAKKDQNTSESGTVTETIMGA